MWGTNTKHYSFALDVQPKERAGNGHTKINTRSFEAFIAEAAREQVDPIQYPPFVGRIKLVVRITAPKHRGDLSNCLKTIEDALNRIAYVDDKQIDEIEIVRRIYPKTMVTVDVHEWINE